MGIISKIKSVLGVSDDGEERPRDRRSTATGDAEPETSSERAVKGVDATTGERAETGGDTSSGGGMETGDREPTSQAGSQADEAAEPVAGDRTGGGIQDEAPRDTASEPPEAGGEPVDSIKGVGSAYAQRLADAGVHSVSDLARADPEELAAATDLGAGRVGKWIERARTRTE